MNFTERTELRKALLANGYRPLPLLDKGIRIKGWSTADINQEWLDQYARSGKYKNTGIRTDDLIAFDIDVYDEDLADEIEELIEDACGETDFCRVGHWPKRLLLYRLVGESIRSARTGKYAEHQVELLAGSGRQFAAFGIHPGTGKPYQWEGWNPRYHAIDKVPELDGLTAQGVLETIEALFEAKGLEKRSLGTTIGSTGQTLHDLTPDTLFELDGEQIQWAELRDTLDDRGVWLNMQRENGEFGDSRGVHAFLAHGSGQPTVHDFPRDTTHQEAVQTLQLPDPPADGLFGTRTALDDMLEKWVLFSDQTMRRVNHPLREYSVQGMKTRLRPITVDTPTSRNPSKTTPLMEMWLSNPNKLSADYAQLRPDRPDTVLIDQGEETVFNTYRRPHHPDRDGEIDTFNEFMEHLIPDAFERNLFLDWLALKVKHPSWRLHCFLMVTREYGTGRGTLFQIVERLFGIEYVHSTEYDDLLGHTSQSTYNAYLANSLIVTVGEVFEKAERVQDWEARKIAYERLKSISESVARPMHIKRKYGRNSHEMVYASLLVSSNHDNALAIEPGDRRLIVVDNTTTSLVKAPDNLHDRIHQWQTEPANIGRLYAMLERRAERAGYDAFGAPPLTPAKQRMIDAAQSDFDVLYQRFVEQAKGDVCTHYQWEMFARRAQLDGEYDLPTGEKFKRGAMAVLRNRAIRFDHLGDRGQVKIDGRPERPWIIKNEEKWKGIKDHEAICAAVTKNGPLKATVSPLQPD